MFLSHCNMLRNIFAIYVFWQIIYQFCQQLYILDVTGLLIFTELNGNGLHHKCFMWVSPASGSMSIIYDLFLMNDFVVELAKTEIGVGIIHLVKKIQNKYKNVHLHAIQKIDNNFDNNFKKILIKILIKVFKTNITKNHHKNIDKIFNVCITELCLQIGMILYFYTCLLFENLPTYTISDSDFLKIFKNADKNSETKLIKVITKIFLKILMKWSIYKKIFINSDNLYFINLSLYYEILYLKISSCKKLCSNIVSSNDLKISYINYYFQTIDTNVFLKTYREKIKTNILIKNSYNMLLIDNKLGYFFNISNNIICQISFSIITKISFSNTQLIKIHSLQEILHKLVISRFIFELFVNLIVLVGTLCAPDFVRLNIKYMIHSTSLKMNQVITTFMDPKYILFISLIHFNYYEKYE